MYHGHNLFIYSQEEFHMRDGQKEMWLHKSHMDTNFQSPIMLMINCESCLLSSSILNHPIPPTPEKNIFSCLIWFLLSLLNSVKWNKVNNGHQFVQLKVVFSLKNFENVNLQPDISYHFSHYLPRTLLRFLYWLIFITYFINHRPILTFIPLFQVCYNEKVLEFWSRLPSSLWKPSKKNGYLPSWRGL